MDVNFRELREIVKDSEAWQVTVHKVVKSWTQLRDWTITTPVGVKRLFLEFKKDGEGGIPWWSSG